MPVPTRSPAEHALIVRLAAPSLSQAHEQLATALAQVPGVQGVLPADADMASVAERAITEYSERVQRLQASAAMLAREFGAEQLQASAAELAQRQPGPAEELELTRLENLTRRAPELARIKRFLIPLPENPELGSLRMQQELLAIALRHVDAMAGDATRLDGVLLHDFAQYHAAYAAALQAHLAERDRQIRDWLAGLKELKQQLYVISQLDSIPELGAAAGPELETRLGELRTQHPVLRKTKAEIQRALDRSPAVAGIDLATPLPGAELAEYSQALAAALAAKLARLAEVGTLAVLTQSREPALKKLIQLTSLTNLNKITALFTAKTTPRLLAELRRLLGSEPAPERQVELAGFQPSLDAITTSKEADKIGRELASWLKNQLKSSPAHSFILKA